MAQDLRPFAFYFGIVGVSWIHGEARGEILIYNEKCKVSDEALEVDRETGISNTKVPL